jgi:hypothetical protein
MDVGIACEIDISEELAQAAESICHLTSINTPCTLSRPESFRGSEQI